eukprot:tig00000093_g3468.t1
MDEAHRATAAARFRRAVQVISAANEFASYTRNLPVIDHRDLSAVSPVLFLKLDDVEIQTHETQARQLQEMQRAAGAAGKQLQATASGDDAEERQRRRMAARTLSLLGPAAPEWEPPSARAKKGAKGEYKTSVRVYKMAAKPLTEEQRAALRRPRSRSLIDFDGRKRRAGEIRGGAAPPPLNAPGDSRSRSPSPPPALPAPAGPRPRRRRRPTGGGERAEEERRPAGGARPCWATRTRRRMERERAPRATKRRGGGRAGPAGRPPRPARPPPAPGRPRPRPGSRAELAAYRPSSAAARKLDRVARAGRRAQAGRPGAEEAGGSLAALSRLQIELSAGPSSPAPSAASSRRPVAAQFPVPALPVALLPEPALYEPANLVRRDLLRFDAGLRALTRDLWKAVAASAKGEAGGIDREAYMAVSRLFYRALHRRWDPAHADACAAADWEADSRGQPTMSPAAFAGSLFELVDLWTEGVGAEEYRRLLSGLVEAITERSEGVDGRPAHALRKIWEVEPGCCAPLVLETARPARSAPRRPPPRVRAADGARGRPRGSRSPSPGGADSRATSPAPRSSAASRAPRRRAGLCRLDGALPPAPEWEGMSARAARWLRMGAAYQQGARAPPTRSGPPASPARPSAPPPDPRRPPPSRVRPRLWPGLEPGAWKALEPPAGPGPGTPSPPAGPGTRRRPAQPAPAASAPPPGLPARLAARPGASASLPTLPPRRPGAAAGHAASSPLLTAGAIAAKRPASAYTAAAAEAAARAARMKADLLEAAARAAAAPPRPAGLPPRAPPPRSPPCPWPPPRTPRRRPRARAPARGSAARPPPPPSPLAPPHAAPGRGRAAAAAAAAAGAAAEGGGAAAGVRAAGGALARAPSRARASSAPAPAPAAPVLPAPAPPGPSAAQRPPAAGARRPAPPRPGSAGPVAGVELAPFELRVGPAARHR